MVKCTSSKHVTSWDGNCICYDQLVTNWDSLRWLVCRLLYPVVTTTHEASLITFCDMLKIVQIGSSPPSSDENKTCLTSQPDWTPQLSIFWHHSISYAYRLVSLSFAQVCIVWKTDWLVLSPTYCSQDQRNHSWKTYDSTLFNSFFTWIMKNVEKITEIAEVNHFFPQPGSLKWPCTYHNLVHLGNSTGEVGGSKRKIKPDQDAPKPNQPVGSHVYTKHITHGQVYIMIHVIHV